MKGKDFIEAIERKNAKSSYHTPILTTIKICIHLTFPSREYSLCSRATLHCFLCILKNSLSISSCVISFGTSIIFPNVFFQDLCKFSICRLETERFSSTFVLFLLFSNSSSLFFRYKNPLVTSLVSLHLIINDKMISMF